MFRAIPLLLALLLPHGAPASEAPYQPPGDTLPFDAGPVTGALMLPSDFVPGTRGVVIMLHDAFGPDPRSAPYEDQLLSAGVPVISVLTGAAPDIMAEVTAAAAADPRLRARGVALLGFGEGARLALAAEGGFAARALLYPGCDALPVPGGAHPLLLAHGTEDPANTEAACADAAFRWGREGRQVRHIAYRGASYAWDAAAFGRELRYRLPRPDGEGHVIAEPWPQLARMSASEVAGFLAQALR
jgi:dienelactone hydrolase